MADLIFQNYHKHSYWSNIKVSDSATSLEEYCKRAVELGHGIISSLEHGWQGHYIECHQLAAKYNLKFLFGVEAYWVKDRFYVDENGRKDGANCHICLLAMNENGRQAINEILSQAAEDCYFKDTFYRQTRIDLPLIMSFGGIKEFFKQKGYAIKFKKANYILTPSAFKQIYLGAIGEVVGKFLIEQELGYDLKELDDYTKYEYFDYQCYNLFFDFKHWNNFIKDNDNYVKKILWKLNRVKGEKCVVVNLIKRNKASPKINIDENIATINFENAI